MSHTRSIPRAPKAPSRTPRGLRASPPRSCRPRPGQPETAFPRLPGSRPSCHRRRQGRLLRLQASFRRRRNLCFRVGSLAVRVDPGLRSAERQAASEAAGFPPADTPERTPRGCPSRSRPTIRRQRPPQHRSAKAAHCPCSRWRAQSGARTQLQPAPRQSRTPRPPRGPRSARRHAPHGRAPSDLCVVPPLPSVVLS